MRKKYHLISISNEEVNQKRYVSLLDDVADHYEYAVGSQQIAYDLRRLCDLVLTLPLDFFSNKEA